MRIPNCLAKTAAALALAALAVPPGSAVAAEVTGTLTFSGPLALDPIPGIGLADLTVSVGPTIEATDGGEQCEITATDTGDVDAGTASYPNVDPLAVGLKIRKGGGPQVPAGSCVLQLRATGTDGVSRSARGTVIVQVSAAEIGSNAAIAVPDIIVARESKALAGLSKDCLKYFKKQMKLRAKCNALLLKGGSAAATKCKAAEDEPLTCDPANYAETVVALAFGLNDQVVDPMTAQAVDTVALADQYKCQRSIGKAAVNFAAARAQRVQKDCVATLADSDACRLQAERDSRVKLAAIDKCVGDQLADVTTGLLVPEIGDECGGCISGGVLDRKCLKDCFQLTIGPWTDAVVGDVPECGNGIVQGGEACDDGNLVAGDGCENDCTVTPAP